MLLAVFSDMGMADCIEKMKVRGSTEKSDPFSKYCYCCDLRREWLLALSYSAG